MPKENKILKWSLYGIFAAFIPFFLLAIFYILFSSLLSELVNTILGAVMFVLSLIVLVLFPVGYLSALVEIVRSKNDTKWKLLWSLSILTVVLSFIYNIVSYFASNIFTALLFLLTLPLGLFTLVFALYTIVRAKDSVGRKILLLISIFISGILPIYYFIGRKELKE